MDSLPERVMQLEKILDGILSILGVGALIYGLRKYRKTRPKPTANNQVTRVDYLSGNYERQLQEREKQLRRDHQLGGIYMGVGVGLFLSALYLVSRLDKK